MLGGIRRIIAAEVHRRRSGRLPVTLYSLGTGERFDIAPAPNGFIDCASGLTVAIGDDRLIPAGYDVVDLRLIGDVEFEGYDHNSGEIFSGRGWGGASVTVYEESAASYFQFAVAAEIAA